MLSTEIESKHPEKSISTLHCMIMLCLYNLFLAVVVLSRENQPSDLRGN